MIPTGFTAVDYFDPVDPDDAEATEDAEGFSGAEEEPEPAPGPESTSTHAVREAHLRDFAKGEVNTAW